MGHADRLSSERTERFNRCFEAHFDQVLAFALRRSSSREDAEDIAAEAFAVAWRRLERLPERELPWLLGVANGVLRNQRRSTRRRSRLVGKLHAEPAGQSRDHAEAFGDRKAAATAFSRLSDSQREVLQLIAWEGLSNRDAAAVLRCSHTALRVRLHRARREMAKQLALAGHETGDEHRDVKAPPQEAR